MGIDSTEKGMEEEKAYFDKMVDKIANKEQVKELGYFFGVHEAKILKEGSMVPFGSNSVTPILHASEPEKSTHDLDDAEKRSAEEADKQAAEVLNEFYKSLII
jgi:hypothetical protein